MLLWSVVIYMCLAFFFCSFEMSCEKIVYWSCLFMVLNTSCSWMPTCPLEKLTVFEEMLFFLMHLVFLVCSYKPFMPSRAYCIWSKYLVYGFSFHLIVTILQTYVLLPYKLTYLYFYKIPLLWGGHCETIKEGQKFYIWDSIFFWLLSGFTTC